MQNAVLFGHTVTAALAIIGMTATAADARAQSVPQNGVTLNRPAPAPAKRPFSRLFFLPGQTDPSTIPGLARPRTVGIPAAAAPQPTVVCGMRLVPIDPAVDAGMRRLAPASPRGTIRAVEPSMCR